MPDDKLEKYILLVQNDFPVRVSSFLLFLFLFISKVSPASNLQFETKVSRSFSLLADLVVRSNFYFPFIFRVLYLHSSVRNRLRRRRVRMLAMIYIYRDRIR